MIGKISLGANQRKATSGNVTPRATPTSTSVGASAPRAMRLSATSATSPVTTHLPLLRQRPSGTREYRIATNPAAKSMTCSDGSAQPPVRPDLHPERPRPMGDRSQHGPDHLHQGSEDHPDDQMPEAPQHHQRQHQPPHQPEQGPP